MLLLGRRYMSFEGPGVMPEKRPSEKASAMTHVWQRVAVFLHIEPLPASVRC